SERLDVLSRERVAADLGLVADFDVLEELHARSWEPCSGFAVPASAARRANIGLTVSVISLVPEPSTSSNRKWTKPMLGRLRDTRVSSTVARALMAWPARTGASQRTSSTPGAPRKLDRLSSSSLSMRISTQQLCQPE